MELQGKSIPSSGKEPGHFYTRQLADRMVGFEPHRGRDKLRAEP